MKSLKPEMLDVSPFNEKSVVQFKAAHKSIYKRRQGRQILAYKDTKYWDKLMNRTSFSDTFKKKTRKNEAHFN